MDHGMISAISAAAGRETSLLNLQADIGGSSVTTRCDSSTYLSCSSGSRGSQLTTGSKELDDLLVLSELLHQNKLDVLTAPKTKKKPPSTYLCHLCFKPEHFIKDCPLVYIEAYISLN